MKRAEVYIDEETGEIYVRPIWSDKLIPVEEREGRVRVTWEED